MLPPGKPLTTYQGMFEADNRVWMEEIIMNDQDPLAAIYPADELIFESTLQSNSKSFMVRLSFTNHGSEISPAPGKV
jgi:hypothetical protein